MDLKFWSSLQFPSRPRCASPLTASPFTPHTFTSSQVTPITSPSEREMQQVSRPPSLQRDLCMFTDPPLGAG